MKKHFHMVKKYDKHFNRIRLFWAAEAHKKFMDKKNKSSKEQVLEIEKLVFKTIFQVFVAICSLVAILSAVIYTAIWFL